MYAQSLGFCPGLGFPEIRGNTEDIYMYIRIILGEWKRTWKLLFRVSGLGLGSRGSEI